MKKRKPAKKDIDAVYIVLRPTLPGPFVLLRSEIKKGSTGTPLERRPLTPAEVASYMPPPMIRSVRLERKAARARAIAHAWRHGGRFPSPPRKVKGETA